MMKNLLLFVLLICAYQQSSAQKHDYVWTIGTIHQGPTQTIFKRMNLDFNVNTPNIQVINNDRTNYTSQSASICDSDGNLLFYTDGCFIGNANYQLMENGNRLNDYDDYDYYCPARSEERNGVLILPDLLDSTKYNLIHAFTEINFDASTRKELLSVLYLSHTQVDMHLDDGYGAVTTKNNLLLQDTMMGGFLSAVKNDDKTAWWVVTAEAGSTNLIRFLVKSDTIEGPYTQSIGQEVYRFEGTKRGNSVFSPDGSKLAFYEQESKLKLFDFDRESGLVSNVQEIEKPFLTFDFFSGITFSPNSRFLYITNVATVYQLDTEAQNLENAFVEIADYGRFEDSITRERVDFFMPTLAPDCRIYITATNRARFLHIIHQPDLPYPDCDVELRGVELPGVTSILPVFPNYRLDNEPVCDPGLSLLTNVAELISPDTNPYLLRVSPNPGPGLFKFRAEIPYDQTTFRLMIYALDGKQLRSVSWPTGQTDTSIDLSDLGSGMYIYYLQDKTGRVYGKNKLIKL